MSYMKTHSLSHVPVGGVLRTLLILWLAASLATSCVPDLTDDINTPYALIERVDMAIDGALNEAIHIESGSGLISAERSHFPFYNENEYLVRIQLNATASLEFSVFDYYQDNPLSIETRFSAYPAADMEDKPAYVIVNYVTGESNVAFSTTLEELPPQIQPNIFEIREVFENGFNVRIRDLVLFASENGGYNGSITINGTFVALYNE